MSVKVIAVNRFNGGIAIGDKEGIPSSYRFGYGVNIHDDPSKFSSLPKGINVLAGSASQTQMVGGTVMNAQIKWIVSGSPGISAVFAYDAAGTIYKEDSSGNWTVLRQLPNSVGQGMGVYNNYLYYVQNTQIGRYGPLDSSPTFTDNWQTGLTDTSALGFAPVLAVGKGIAFGNGSNVSWWDGTTFTLARILLPPQCKCMSMCRIEQYLMIGTVGSNSVMDNEEGFVFAWDTASVQFNFFNNIEQGANNCLVNYRNQPLSVNGTSGTIYLGIDPFVKVHQLPKLPISSSVQVYPGAVTSWKGRIFIGFAATSTDTNFLRGVYGFGAKTNAYPDALTCDYQISTGNTGSSVAVTACKGLGNAFYYAWQDGSNFGLDKVTNSNSPQPVARMDFLIFDDGRIPQDKNADTVRVDHSALRPGESVSIYTRTNRLSNFTVAKIVHSYSASEDSTVSNTTRWRVPASESRFQEFEWGVGISCGTTSPEVYGVSLKYDDLEKEEAI